MADFDPTPPKFSFEFQNPNLGNIGAGYAAGIESAGKSIGQGISNVMDVMNRQQTANDLLGTMTQMKMIDPEVAKSLAGKSLGAKESMIGMMSGQWIAQQAQARELAKMGYGSTLDVQKAHDMLLDQLTQWQKLYGSKPGGDIRSTPYSVVTGKTGPAAAATTTGSTVTPPTPIPVMQNVPATATTPAIAATGTSQNPSPMGSGNIYNPVQANPVPQVRVSPTGWPAKTPVPAGAKVVYDANGRPGIQINDTFYPRQ
jgi:hypothetical protein